jgi:hypothetical protein
MSGDHLRALLRAEPFRPFTMGLVGKNRVRIDRSDCAMVSPDGETLVAFDATQSLQIVSVAQVASLQFDPPPPQPDAIIGN